jgi:hypothetical protein
MPGLLKKWKAQGPNWKLFATDKLLFLGTNVGQVDGWGPKYQYPYGHLPLGMSSEDFDKHLPDFLNEEQKEVAGDYQGWMWGT